MGTVHLMMGIPGSGKSYKGKRIAEKENGEYISSDDIREELYGDAQIQRDHTYIFKVMEERLLAALSNGRVVVYDATNSSRRIRTHLIKQVLKKHEVIGHCLLTPLEMCRERNQSRERTVSEAGISNMYKGFHFPFMFEGFKDIHYYIEPDSSSSQKEELEQLLLSRATYTDLFDELQKMAKEFETIYELPQDSSYHSFSVSRHTYHVYQNVLNEEHSETELQMLWVAVFHDLGKGYCKSFRNYKGELQRYANFKGHENVSAYLAYHYLTNLGYDHTFVEGVVKMISLHMLPKSATDKTMNKLFHWLTRTEYNNLLLFNENDNQAK